MQLWLLFNITYTNTIIAYEYVCIGWTLIRRGNMIWDQWWVKQVTASAEMTGSLCCYSDQLLQQWHTHTHTHTHTHCVCLLRFVDKASPSLPITHQPSSAPLGPTHTRYTHTHTHDTQKHTLAGHAITHKDTCKVTPQQTPDAQN